jgi:GAF domain-containing protein
MGAAGTMWAQRGAIRVPDAQLPLAAALTAVCRRLEADCADGARASIMRHDQATGMLDLVAWHGLPEAYARDVIALGGIPVGPRNGSCGAAAFRRRTVVVEDIATDPLWDGYRELPLAHGLKSCWSSPILSMGGAVLGTLALHRRHIHRMDAHDYETLRRAAQDAALAFETFGREAASAMA